MTESDLTRLAGRAPESLDLTERTALAGKWIALEIYTPAGTPLKLIEAIGESAADCARQVAARGLDAHKFEFQLFA